ncbi:Gluconate 5-dehydrogenase [uncultured Alphaproteobacteria bacterium]|uniref:Gluconate 5-dehydrogenase n=1 Tax=uncultured Alphaproteobacteria bacterium TaxID=91750 RepID=A0A212JL07_9PROT|nr:Gluconate 5-dehydrogenase [uncultured Alphaproteobacteria bacterium]
MSLLEGKTALVTGGGRGIGRAIAQALVEAGATVYIAARSADQLAAAAEALDPRGEGRVRPVTIDVSDAASVKAGVRQVADDGARVDILVNSAGVNLRGPIETLPEDTWDRVIDTNLKGVFLMGQAVFPMMKASGGKVVNIASLMAEIARPTISPYAASKGGVRQLTKAMAVEWAPYDIQVNGITPGFIATEMNLPLMQDKAFNDFIVNRTPAKRWGKPEDIAAAALFLVSPGANFVTGQILAVDGGLLAAL